MRVFHDIKVGLDTDLEEHLSWLAPNFGQYRILKKSVDARVRHSPHFVYSVQVFDPNETPPPTVEPLEKVNYKGARPVIIGAGPAGLFAALRLVERGVPCLLLERGSESMTRMKAINRFWRYGELNRRNNVCYGEGGAGLYSDGKLITRIKSPHIPYVMNRLVQFGAPAEIEYLSNPHVGSDRIRRVIPKMRQFIIEHGGEIRFDNQVTELLTEGKKVVGVKVESGDKFYSDKIILATGHSAEDMLTHLDEIGVHIDGKSFAVGLRIEHPQSEINKIQFREEWANPKLGAANYKLTHHLKDKDVGIYSFCMCPGGYVLSSGTEPDGIVCNGMSNFNRNSPYANSALVVTVDHHKSFGADKWGGLKFRKMVESAAFQFVQKNGGNKQIPAQPLVDFLDGRMSTNALPTSSPSGVVPAPLHQLFNSEIYDYLRLGIESFQRNMKGFISPLAQLHAVESRTSSPVRITRDPERLESISHQGLYPCGEGAGYAGGITSAACDGVRIVEKILAPA